MKWPGSLERNSRGEWCVAVEVEEVSYGAVHDVRRLYRIPVPRTATRSEAEASAAALGIELGGGYGSEG